MPLPHILTHTHALRLLQVSLSLQTLLDDGEFQADQAELDTLDFKSDLQEDYVMVRRLAMTRGDAIRNTNMQEKVSRLSVCCAPRMDGGDGERCWSAGGLMFARCSTPETCVCTAIISTSMCRPT